MIRFLVVFFWLMILPILHKTIFPAPVGRFRLRMSVGGGFFFDIDV